MKFELRHLLMRPDGDEARGVLGRESLPAYEGDGLKIMAKLSEPAYCYIVAFWPNGGEELAFPPDSTKSPPKTDKPRYPWDDPTVSYGLTDGTGLEAIFLIVSREPLPPWEEWRKQLPPSPWKSMEARPEDFWVYKQGYLFDEHQERGKDRENKGPGRMVAELGKWLKRPGIERVQGIGFAVRPATEKPPR